MAVEKEVALSRETKPKKRRTRQSRWGAFSLHPEATYRAQRIHRFSG
jgi:hypothetical protein